MRENRFSSPRRVQGVQPFDLLHVDYIGKVEEVRNAKQRIGSSGHKPLFYRAALILLVLIVVVFLRVEFDDAGPG